MKSTFESIKDEFKLFKEVTGHESLYMFTISSLKIFNVVTNYQPNVMTVYFEKDLISSVHHIFNIISRNFNTFIF